MTNRINKDFDISILFKIILFTIFISIYTISFYFNLYNNFIIFFEMILIASLIYLEYKNTNIIVSPMIFWLIFWLLVITIARVDLKIYQFKQWWTEKLLVYVVLNTITFFIVYIIFQQVVLKRKKNTKTGIEFNYNVLSKITFIIFVISNIAFIINIVYLGYIPQLSSNVNLLRANFVVTPFFSIINVTRFIFSFVPIVLKKSSNNKYKRHIIVQAAISLIFNFLTGWRGYVLQILVFMLSSQILISNIKSKKEKKQQIKIIIRYLIVAILFFGIIAITRANSVSGQLDKSEYLSYTLEQIYMYITPNFINFGNAINEIAPNGNFLYTSEFVWGILLSGEYMPGYKPLSFSIGAFNVSTYLLHPYADFGLLGTILWTSIIAAYSASIFRKAQKTKSIFYITFVGLCNIIIFNMHNGFFLRSSSVLFWIFSTKLIEKKCTRISKAK